MASSRRKQVRPDPDKRKSDEPFSCPLCGEEAVERVRGNCKLLDGTIIRNLSRLHCSKCGEDFFDDAAMDEIRRQRSKQRANAKG